MEKKLNNDEKNLLLKDLCARLPYKPQVEIIKDGTSITDKLTTATIKYLEGGCWDVKPYLLPLSSMTDEQKEIYCQLQQKVIYNSKGVVTEDVMNYINWCYENHLDVNDLIPKGLAIDATNLNIYLYESK